MLFRFIPCVIHNAIITTSINTLTKKTGIVIRVGNAARFTTKHDTIATIVKGQ